MINAVGEFQRRTGRDISATRSTHARAEPAPALTKIETSESRSLFISPIPDVERNRIVPWGYIRVNDSAHTSKIDGDNRD